MLAKRFALRTFVVALAGGVMLLGGCPQATPIDPNNADPNSGNGTPTAFDAPPDEPLAVGTLKPRSAAAPPASLLPWALLNEIGMNPAAGDSAFVELKAVAGADLGGHTLENGDGESYALPAGAAPNDAGLLVIWFDGGDSVGPGEVHAASTALVSAAGTLVLRDAGGAQLDRISWGLPDGVPLNLAGGSGPENPPTGISVGRRPTAVDVGRQGWTVFAANWTTPGAPNPNPGVTMLLPLDGFHVAAGVTTLSWYVVPDATAYQVQLARDRDFAAVLLDQTATTPSIDTPPLASGTYYWRVRAQFADGTTADDSPEAQLIVDDELNLENVGAPPAAGKALTSQSSLSLIRRVLGNFPRLAQRKDTRLLTLQSGRMDAGHGWDEPHVGLDPTDPADAMNCTIASTTMVNHFFGGDLSQDRISYEVRNADAPGPETDLNFGVGIWPDAPLTYAIGVAPSRPLMRSSVDLWQQVVTDIENNRPAVIVLANAGGASSHTTVVTGYEYDARSTPAQYYLIMHDPWNIGRTDARIGKVGLLSAARRFLAYYDFPAEVAVGPRRQESEVTQDTDGDGIMDFDEQRRFNTQWQSPVTGLDTDQDCLPDKAEIRRSVLDAQHGYGVYESFGQGDGKARAGNPPETSPDTDGGGVMDGVEVTDPNSLDVQGGDTDPYSSNDDQMTISGTFHHQLVNHMLSLPVELLTYEAYHEENLDVEFTISAMPGSDGMLTGTALCHWTNEGYWLYRDPNICGGREPISSAPQTWQTRVRGELRCAEDGDGSRRYFLTLTALDMNNANITVRYECEGTEVSAGGLIFLGGLTTFGPFEPLTEENLRGARYQKERNTPHLPGSYNDVGFDKLTWDLSVQR